MRLLLAAIVLARGRRWRVAAVCLGLTAGAKTFGLMLAPFVLLGGTDLASLSVFTREWNFNSALFGPLSAAVPPLEARLVLGFAFAVCWGYYFARHSRSGAHGIPRGDWVYGALLVVSPVVNPWYLLWPLPFAVVFPSIWARTASTAILLSYVTGLNMQECEMHPYAQPLWARWLEFCLMLGDAAATWLGADGSAARKLAARSRGSSAPASASSV